MSALTTSIQHCIEVFASAVRKKEMKSIRIGKKDVKLSLCRDVLVNVENPTEPMN